MAWERRANRGRYYYRGRYVDGRVVKEYIGTGEVGEIAARLDAEARARRAAEAAANRAREAMLEPIERTMRDLHAGCTTLMAAVLLTSGFYQHARSEWRRRRGRPETDPA